jgi:hypothetical protein
MFFSTGPKISRRKGDFLLATTPVYCMRTGSSREIFFEAWVDGVARHIHDPVQRLRFVRVAGPCGPHTPPIPKRVRALLFPDAIAVLLFLLLVSATAYLGFHENSRPPERSSSPFTTHPGPRRAQ